MTYRVSVLAVSGLTRFRSRLPISASVPARSRTTRPHALRPPIGKAAETRRNAAMFASDLEQEAEEELPPSSSVCEAQEGVAVESVVVIAVAWTEVALGASNESF